MSLRMRAVLCLGSLPVYSGGPLSRAVLAATRRGYTAAACHMPCLPEEQPARRRHRNAPCCATCLQGGSATSGPQAGGMAAGGICRVTWWLQVVLHMADHGPPVSNTHRIGGGTREPSKHCLIWASAKQACQGWAAQRAPQNTTPFGSQWDYLWRLYWL